MTLNYTYMIASLKNLENCAIKPRSESFEYLATDLHYACHLFVQQKDLRVQLERGI